MKSLRTWIEGLQRQGKLIFTAEQLENQFPDKSTKALELNLYRLSHSGQIKSVHKGFYTIIPPQHRNLGGLPPEWYIDDLMRYLDKDYYVSHLTAAALLGSAHQQPQQFYTVHNGSTLRPLSRSVVPVNFIKKERWPVKGVIKRKTQTGYFFASNPLMTALDLVNDQSRIGGIDRASMIIDELADQVEFDGEIIPFFPEAVIQRFGYILDSLGWEDLAKEIYDKVFSTEKPTHRYALKTGKSMKGHSSRNRWNIVENTPIEIDE